MIDPRPAGTPPRVADPNPWSAMSLALDRGWNGKFTPEDERGYRLHLEGAFTPEVVVAAVVSLGRRDRAYNGRPSASEVAAECDRIAHPELAPVSWIELWASMEAAIKSRDLPRGDTPTGRAAWVGSTVAHELGPVAGAFAAAVYTRIIREPIYDPAQAGPIVARYTAEWREFQSDMRTRGLQGGNVPTPAEVLQRSGRRPRVLRAGAPALSLAAGGIVRGALGAPGQEPSA